MTKKITHKEILDYLKNNGLLYDIIDDENDCGELEIVGMKLNNVENIIVELQKAKKEMQKLVKTLKSKVVSKEGGVYFNSLKNICVNGKTISFEKDCFFLDCEGLIFTNNYFSLVKKKAIYVLGSKEKQ